MFDNNYLALHQKRVLDYTVNYSCNELNLHLIDYKASLLLSRYLLAIRSTTHEDIGAKEQVWDQEKGEHKKVGLHFMATPMCPSQGNIHDISTWDTFDLDISWMLYTIGRTTNFHFVVATLKKLNCNILRSI